MFIITIYQHVEKHYMEKYNNNILSLVKKQNFQHFRKWVWHFSPQLVVKHFFYSFARCCLVYYCTSFTFLNYYWCNDSLLFAINFPGITKLYNDLSIGSRGLPLLGKFSKEVLPDAHNNLETLYDFMARRPDQGLMISFIMLKFWAC